MSWVLSWAGGTMNSKRGGNLCSNTKSLISNRVIALRESIAK